MHNQGHSGYDSSVSLAGAPVYDNRAQYENKVPYNENAAKAPSFHDEKLSCIHGKLEKLGVLRNALVDKLRPVLDVRDRPDATEVMGVGLAKRGPVSELDRTLQEIEYTVDTRLAQFAQLLDDIQL